MHIKRSFLKSFQEDSLFGSDSDITVDQQEREIECEQDSNLTHNTSMAATSSASRSTTQSKLL